MTRLHNPPHSEKYTLPFVALLTVRGNWGVSLRRSHDPEFSFRQTEIPDTVESMDLPATRYQRSIHAAPMFRFGRGRRDCVAYDAFEVTKTFLDLKSPQDALRFFSRFGPFQLLRDGAEEYKAQPVRWSLIQRAQSDFSTALLNDSIPAGLFEFVFGQPIKVELKFRAATPESLLPDPTWIGDAAIADCDDVVTALRSAIFLKRMRGFRWRRCARKGCNELFQLERRYKKIYHSPECGHLQAVNDYNARQKTKKKRR